MGFKKPKKHRKLKKRLDAGSRRKIAGSILGLVILLGGIAFLIDHLRQEGVPDFSDGEKTLSPVSARATPVPFSAERTWADATRAFNEARSNEYRGNKRDVAARYAAALEAFSTLREKAPDFKPREVEGRIAFCRRKLRKAW